MIKNKIIQEDIQYIVNQNLDWERFENKTVLISGASGFLAYYMIETFLYLNKIKNLNIKIIGMVRNLEKIKKKFEDIYYNGITFIVQDICDKIEIEEPIDYIIHMASQASPKVFKDDPVGAILPNIIGTHNLLELSKEKKVKQFIFFSTSGVYGILDNNQYPANENSFNGYLNPTDLSSCYLESKRAGENLCIAYMNQYDIPIKIIRPSITYGPGIKLDDGRVFADFVNSILNKKDIVLTSDGKACRNFCYIADFIVGFFIILIKGKVGEAYNLASENEIIIKDLADLLIKKVFKELDLKIIFDKNNYIRTEFSRTQMNINKVKKLGWNTNFNIEEGFKRMVQSYE